jgi:hypothetical protein
MSCIVFVFIKKYSGISDFVVRINDLQQSVFNLRLNGRVRWFCNYFFIKMKSVDVGTLEDIN